MRWLVVYIQEAHASDEWPVGDLTSVTTQPKSLSHRRELARTAHEDLLGGSVEVLVDDMDNSFQVITSADRQPPTADRTCCCLFSAARLLTSVFGGGRMRWRVGRSECLCWIRAAGR